MKRSMFPILAAVLIFGFSGCNKDDDSPTTPTPPGPDTTAPAVPATLSPAPGTVFNHFPRTTTLVWSAVTDPSAPVTYRVQIQFCQGTVGSPTSCTDRSWPGCDGVQSSTSCTFSFVGAQPGRWRVKAVDSLGNTSDESDWSIFAFSL